jgi:endogenous inhibitor of DNA gyrase (YacG/DUF329 family)
MTEKKVIKLNCPTCQKQITWDETFQHRPFCSERCKLIDLGEWASESHKIAGSSILEDEFLDDFPEQ